MARGTTRKGEHEVRCFDLETGQGLCQMLLGVPVTEPEEGWGYIIWEFCISESGRATEREVRSAGGFPTEESAEAAAAAWLDKVHGKGNWSW